MRVARSPRVLNARGRAPAGAVYVGRPHPRYRALGFGNKYRIGRGVSRMEAIRRFVMDALEDSGFLARVRLELAGKDLLCWCAPEPCHADFLLVVANARGRADVEAYLERIGLEATFDWPPRLRGKRDGLEPFCNQGGTRHEVGFVGIGAVIRVCSVCSKVDVEGVCVRCGEMFCYPRPCVIIGSGRRL